MDDSIAPKLDSPTSKPSNDFNPMRGVLRTVEVLTALNVRNGATVVELSRHTGISRGALYRVLETLREAGYVAVDLSGRHYCLTMRVRGLAEGYAEDDWIAEVARPALRKLQKVVLWPVDLGTFMGNALWLRETTRSFSPLTIDRRVVGVARGPLLGTAAGRCYLAHCPAAERELIISNLIAEKEPGYEIAQDRERLDRLISETRERGYGARFDEPPVDSGAIAVPIILGERILGCVILTFIRRALTLEKCVHTCLAPMMETAEAISGAIRDRS